MNVRVSIILPVFNAELYLKDAIQSLIDQNFIDYELLIINDGSTDESKKIIQGFRDCRIKHIENAYNLGLIDALNLGIELAKGEYILRMDADDISLPDRIDKQVDFMDKNVNVDISGTWFTIIDTDQVIRHSINSEECKVNLLGHTVLGHPTVIMRSASITKAKLKYKKSAKHAEDYQFWVDAVIAGLTIQNLPEVLLKYRVHNTQVSTVFYDFQCHHSNNIKELYFGYYFPNILKGQNELYLKLINRSIIKYKDYLQVKQIVKEVLLINHVNMDFDQNYLKRFFLNRITTAANNVYKYNVAPGWANLIHSLFDSNFYSLISFKHKLRFVFLSLMLFRKEPI